ncbi:MAG: hypothetical protein AAGA23_08980 [Pseudomonadota bacterium]
MDNAQPSNPQPGEAKTGQTSPTGRGRGTLILIFALFLAPVLAAVFLNSTFSDWRPGSTRNYGQLITPVIPLANELPPRVTGSDTPPWQLLWPRRLSCGDECAAQLAELERIRQTLGRHRDKLEIALLPEGVPDTAPLLAALRARELDPESLYLIDPLGNLMMAYTQPVDATGLRKDLDRLIRHSKFKENR